MEERGRWSVFVIWSAITSYLAWAFRLYLLLIALADKGYEGIYETERERERERVSVCGYVFQCWFSF